MIARDSVRLWLFVGVVLMTTIGSAQAQQPASDRIFVGASVFSEIKRFSGEPGEALLDGNAVGAGLVVGTAIHPRWDVQLGVDMPRETSTSRDRTVTLGKISYTLHSITNNRTLSVAALVRLRGRRVGRVQFGYLAGISFIRLRRDAFTTAPEGTPSGLIPRPVSFIDYSAAPTLGFDARIVLSEHFSLLPGLHATIVNFEPDTGILLWPRVGIRWRF
jgi:hypothetical protein